MYRRSENLLIVTFVIVFNAHAFTNRSNTIVSFSTLPNHMLKSVADDDFSRTLRVWPYKLCLSSSKGLTDPPAVVDTIIAAALVVATDLQTWTLRSARRGGQTYAPRRACCNPHCDWVKRPASCSLPGTCKRILQLWQDGVCWGTDSPYRVFLGTK